MFNIFSHDTMYECAIGTIIRIAFLFLWFWFFRRTVVYSRRNYLEKNVYVIGTISLQLQTAEQHTAGSDADHVYSDALEAASNCRENEPYVFFIWCGKSKTTNSNHNRKLCLICLRKSIYQLNKHSTAYYYNCYMLQFNLF